MCNIKYAKSTQMWMQGQKSSYLSFFFPTKHKIGLFSQNKNIYLILQNLFLLVEKRVADLLFLKIPSGK